MIADALLRFIEDEDYDLRIAWLDKKTLGEINYDKKTITINLMLMVVSVFVHEATHGRHPSWSEAEVELTSNRLVARMSVFEMKRLYDSLTKRFVPRR